MSHSRFSLPQVIILVLLVAVIAAGAGAWFGRDLWQPALAQSTPTPTMETDAPPLIVEGRVVPADSAWLSFNRPGRIVEVLVEAGEMVAEGTPLIRLGDVEAADAAVAGAALEVLRASQALDDLDHAAPLTAGQMRLAQAQAERDLIDAARALEALDTDAFQQRVDDAWEAVLDAQDELDTAQEELDKVLNLDPENARRTRAEDNLETAQTELEDSQRAYDLLLNELESARAAVQGAEANLADIRRQFAAWESGPDPDQLALAQARLEHAEAALTAARVARADLTLLAPFAGVVTQVRAAVGEQVAPNQQVLRLADFSALYVETSDLTELDVVGVTTGAAVRILPDALPGLVLDGVVESIAQDYLERAGDVLYTVRIRLPDPDPRLLWGMTVEVRFDQ
jgi:multidrug efflux pump subunit AcrA (membrane-fusion protein)